MLYTNGESREILIFRIVYTETSAALPNNAWGQRHVLYRLTITWRVSVWRGAKKWREKQEAVRLVMLSNATARHRDAPLIAAIIPFQ